MDKSKNGFTLAELLVVLGVLGIIAGFTIPKVMYQAETSALKAKLKTAVSTFQAVSYAASQNGIRSHSGLISYMKENMNYATFHSGACIDTFRWLGTGDQNYDCFQLHSGVTVNIPNAGHPAYLPDMFAIFVSTDPVHYPYPSYGGEFYTLGLGVNMTGSNYPIGAWGPYLPGEIHPPYDWLGCSVSGPNEKDCIPIDSPWVRLYK